MAASPLDALKQDLVEGRTAGEPFTRWLAETLGR